MKNTKLFKILVFTLAFSPLLASAALTRQLQIGMSGADVSQLQTFLAEDPSVYPQGLVTGYFGSLTKAAVARFQLKNGISAIGRVGPQTMAAINARLGGVSSSNVPVIGSITMLPTNSQAVVSWNTSVPASAIVYYSASPISIAEATEVSLVNVGGTSVIANVTLTTSHSATLTGLSANTTYYYVVYVRDSSGTEHITWPKTFQTPSF